jgi:hypothetical protein
VLSRGDTRGDSWWQKVETSNQDRTISLKAAVRSFINKHTRLGSAAARLLSLRIRIPPGAWMSVCHKCCVLSGRGLCDGLISLPEESYRVWRVVECDLETSRMRRSWIILGRSATGGGGEKYIYMCIQGVPGGKDLTSGECSLGQTIPI